MRTLRTVVLISAVFVVVGPVVGAVVIWLERPPGSFGTVVLLSYAFGGVPALIAGIVYGAASVRGRGAPSPVSGWTVGDLEIRFLRRSIGAGIPAGIVCALLVGSRRSRPKLS